LRLPAESGSLRFNDFILNAVYYPDIFYLKRYEIPTSVGMDIGKIPKQKITSYQLPLAGQ